MCYDQFDRHAWFTVVWQTRTDHLTIEARHRSDHVLYVYEQSLSCRFAFVLVAMSWQCSETIHAHLRWGRLWHNPFAPPQEQTVTCCESSGECPGHSSSLSIAHAFLTAPSVCITGWVFHVYLGKAADVVVVSLRQVPATPHADASYVHLISLVAVRLSSWCRRAPSWHRLAYLVQINN